MTQRGLRILTRSAALALITCVCPATIEASDFHALLIDTNYAAPVRWNVGASLFLSHEDVGHSDGGTGIIVGGGVGKGGMQVWGGTAVLGGPNADVRAVITRTWDNPNGASANSTYVGGEVGFGLLWRVSVGYARRISGHSTRHDQIITWGVGVEVPWFR